MSILNCLRNLGNLSNTTYKLISVFMMLVILALLSIFGVRECTNHRKIDQLKESLEDQQIENENVCKERDKAYKDIDILNAEVARVKALNVAMQAEQEVVSERVKKEQVILKDTEQCMEQIYESVSENPQVNDWFNASVPDDILNILSNAGSR